MLYPEEWIEKELKELKERTFDEVDVFAYYIMEFIKEDDAWLIVEHHFNSNLSPVNGRSPRISKNPLTETENYMKELYDFSCRINGYHPKKDVEEVISDTHIRRKIIDYVDRTKGLKLHKKKAIS